MSSQRTQDILNQAQDFHDRLSAHYNVISSRCTQPRVQMLLQYFAEHEAAMAAVLQRYREDAPKLVLNAWFMHIPDARELNEFEVPLMADDASLDDALDVALLCDRKIMALYEQAEATAVTESVQQVFGNLILWTRGAQAKACRNAQSLNDF